VLPRDVPFAATETPFSMRRVTVGKVVDDPNFGAFDLGMAQVPSPRVFMGREALGNLVGKIDRANILLLSAPGAPTSQLQKSLANVWRLSDLGLSITNAATGAWELRSEHIFLGPLEEKAALDARGTSRPERTGKPVPADLRGSGSSSPDATPVFTYFVNSLRSGARATPYSMVSAPGESVVPPGTPDDAILVNGWLATDLGAGPGDTLDLAYWAFDGTRRLVERTNRFKIARILPISGAAADPSLMPDFPGLADANSCSEWHPGIPVDLKKIRPKDETYWDEHRGTPKAFVTAKAARGMWENAFGASTAVRWPAAAWEGKSELESALLSGLSPSTSGLNFRPAAEEARLGAVGSVDLGGLFLGLSFFLVAASLLLTALFAAFSIERRRPDIATLRALGFPPARIRLAFLAELAVVCLCGGLLGVGLSILYDFAIISALNTLWSGAVAYASLSLHLRPATLLLGFAASFLCGLVAAALALRSQLRRAILRAFTGEAVRKSRKGPARFFLAIGLAAILASFAWNFLDSGRPVSLVFFLAAAGALSSGLSLAHLFFSRGASAKRAFSRATFIRLSSLRNRWRSLATVMLLAVGVFMVLGVSLYREDPSVNAGKLDSGTGGFSLIAEFTLPIANDLRDPAVRKRLGLSGDEWEKTRLFPMRRQEGDDASCLNLHRVKKPPVLGVDGAAFAARGAFRFSQVEKGFQGNPWSLLARPIPDAIPAIADASVLTWNLGKAVGDLIELPDERGGTLRLRIVAALSDSIFQGNLLVDERALLHHFPSVGGTRLLLVDAPQAALPAVSTSLSQALRDFGVEVESAGARLARFTVVQNTYLSVFLALGGLGLILGTVGFAVVLLRNLSDRRAENALLIATGLRIGLLRRLAIIEHTILLLWGLGIGSLAAGVAAFPSLGTGVPMITAASVIIGCAVVGMVALLLSSWAGFRKFGLQDLREE
jgi:ABC-type antimicrobial peptide transport system permease subunit